MEVLEWGATSLGARQRKEETFTGPAQGLTGQGRKQVRKRKEKHGQKKEREEANRKINDKKDRIDVHEKEINI